MVRIPGDGNRTRSAGFASPALVPLLPFPARHRRCGAVVVEQDAVGRTVEVVELPGLKGPQERAQTQQAERQGDGDEIEQFGHGGSPRMRPRGG